MDDRQSQAPARSKTEGLSRPTRPAPRWTEDSRATVRYPLSAEVIFQWTDDRGIPRQSQGLTRDISTKGAYVLASGCPPCGTSISLNILLPFPNEVARALRMETSGRVQRVDSVLSDGFTGGFSVHNERVRICVV